jgi:hypothetical protein
MCFRSAAPGVLLVSFCLAGAGAVAQDKKDPQAAVEPRSQPGACQKFLEKFSGDWHVVKKFYPASGQPVATEGDCRQTMIHGGRFLQSEFTFRKGDLKTTGMGLIGFEPQSGLFTSVWTDFRQTKMSLRQSKAPFDGQEIVLYSKSLAEAGKERTSRTITRLEDVGCRIVHRQYNVGQDGRERLLMELVLTRKEKPAPSTP